MRSGQSNEEGFEAARAIYYNFIERDFDQFMDLCTAYLIGKGYSYNEAIDIVYKNSLVDKVRRGSYK